LLTSQTPSVRTSRRTTRGTALGSLSEISTRALDVDEAAREVPALEILPTLLLDVLRNRAVPRLACVTKEVLQVLLHENEEHGFLRPTRDVGRGQSRHAAPSASPGPTTRRCNPATLRAASRCIPWPGHFRLSPRHPPQSTSRTGARWRDSRDRLAASKSARRDLEESLRSEKIQRFILMLRCLWDQLSQLTVRQRDHGRPHHRTPCNRYDEIGHARSEAKVARSFRLSGRITEKLSLKDL